MTSRRCDCNARAWMLLTDEPRYDPIDVSEFVTYLDPEFAEDDDDGTELRVPDLESLRPPPRPDDRKRRLPSRPIADPNPLTNDIDVSDNDVPESEPTADVQQTEEFDGSERADGPSDDARPKRRRRRGRRRSPDQGPSPAGDSSAVSSVDAGLTSVHSPRPADSADAPPEKAGSPSPRKRRRRRGRRPRGNDSAS